MKSEKCGTLLDISLQLHTLINVSSKYNIAQKKLSPPANMWSIKNDRSQKYHYIRAITARTHPVASNTMQPTIKGFVAVFKRDFLYKDK